VRQSKYHPLSDTDRVNIISLMMVGYNKSEIARELNIPRKTVANFINKYTHKEWWYNNRESVTSSTSLSPNVLSSSILKDAKLERVVVQDNNQGLRIVVIPDAQVKPESNISHIIAAGKYISEHKPDVVVVIGDWWDMLSLSRFGSALDLDGRRVIADINAGYNAMEKLLERFYNKDGYKPRLVFTVGNHDPMVRIPRLVSELPHLQGFVPDDSKRWLEEKGFEVYDFLDVVNIGGIRFSHYFQNPHSAKKSPLSGQIDSMLKNAGFSFVQGHTQGIKIGKHYLGDGTHRVGIVAGSFYQEDESYMGMQGNKHWMGIIHLHEVKDGGADIAEISMNYLLRKYG